MSSRKTWMTNAKRTPFITRSIREPKETFVRNVTSGTQNTDVTGDVQQNALFSGYCGSHTWIWVKRLIVQLHQGQLKL